MKLSPFAALLLLAGAVFSTPVASATLPYTGGDLFLGFRASGGTGGTQDYLVNIGPASQFVGQSGVVTVSGLGDIKSDLDATFGSGWATRSDIYWSVSGANLAADTANTLYATRPRSTVGVPVTPWKGNSPSAQGVTSSKFNQLAGAYINFTPGIPAPVSPKGAIQNSSAPNSYASFQPVFQASGAPVGISYGAFNPSVEGSATGGVVTTELELFKVAPVYGRNGESLGVFTIDSNAVLTFKPASTLAASSLFLQQDTYSVDENDGTHQVVLKVIRGAGLTGAVSVNVATSNGSGAAGAQAGTDYQTVNTSLSFNATDTEKTVPVTIVDRSGFQGDRFFNVAISGATGGGVILPPSSAIVTIKEADAAVKLEKATYAVSEKVANHKLPVKIVRSGGLNGAFAVTFSTVDGTGPSGAVAGTDFTAQTTPLNFVANETEKTVEVDITDRPNFQGDRIFTVQLTGATTGSTTQAPSSAVVTIQEGDAGILAFDAATNQEISVDANAAPNKITVTIKRAETTIGAVSADLSVTGGTLVNGTDYDTIAVPTTINFQAGSSTQTFDIQLKTIAADKLPGTIILGLSNPNGGASIGAVATTTITVNAPEKVAPKVTVAKTIIPANGIVTLTGLASDNSSISRVQVTLNGGAPQLATLGAFADGKLTYTLNNLQLENGKNTVLVTTFDASGNASKATKVTLTYVNPIFATVGGTFNGLAQAVLVADRTHDLTGVLRTVLVTKTGSFTGKLLLGSFEYKLTGIFSNNGAARFGKLETATQTLSRKTTAAPNAPDATLALQLNLAPGADKLAGTVTDTATTKVAIVDADRAIYTSKTNPPVGFAAPTPALVGSFTTIFQADNVPATQALRDAATYPLGDGWATITVDKNGVAKLVGVLADGQPVSATAPLSKTNQWPLFAQLYKKGGSISQKVQFDGAQATVPVDGLDANWFKPANAPKEIYYVAGWPAGITVNVLGAKYAAAPVLPGLNGTGDAVISFFDGDLPANPVDRVLSENIKIDPATSKATFTGANASVIKPSITAKTGIFSGTFLPAGAAKAEAFKGVFVQRATPFAAGFFSGATKTGAVSIDAP
ncbi:MAG: Calx-beta domain-containing protein [Chthoniobacteraceae bacterium]